MARKKKEAGPVKGSWIVEIRCEVIKAVIVEDCTEAEARDDPWDHAVDEMETSQEDWKVLSVKAND